MCFIADDHQGGGGPHPEPEAPPAHTDKMPTPADHIAQVRALLLTAATDPDIPHGSRPNILSSLAKLAIADAELALHPTLSDPVADAKRDMRTDQLTQLLEMYFIRLLELETESARILGELADALAGYTRDCEGARPLWRSLRLARRAWHEAHGRDPDTPYPDPAPPEPDPPDSPGESPP